MRDDPRDRVLACGAAQWHGAEPRAEPRFRRDGCWLERGQRRASRVATDADGCAGSGALFVLSEGGGVQVASGLSACFAVNAQEPLVLAMTYMTEAPQVFLQLKYFVDDQCGAAYAGAPPTFTFAASPSGFSRIMYGVTTPLGVAGARFAASAAYETPTQFSLTVDRTYAGTLPPLLLDDFEAGATCRWIEAQ